MGLDMYLTKRTYVKNWDHTKPEDRHTVTVTKNGKEVIHSERVCYIIEEVAYWRKANAIHSWFVENVQNGIDQCQESFVSRDQLSALVDLCQVVLDTVETVEGEINQGMIFHSDGTVETPVRKGRVIAQKSIPEKLLATQSGFFFGSTAYDELYLQDLEDTIRQIRPLLTEEDEGQFYYQASW